MAAETLISINVIIASRSACISKHAKRLILFDADWDSRGQRYIPRIDCWLFHANRPGQESCPKTQPRNHHQRGSNAHYVLDQECADQWAEEQAGIRQELIRGRVMMDIL